MASLHVRKVPRDPIPIPRPLKPGDRIPIGGQDVTLGRDKKSDCWLPDHTVSKQHARVSVQGNAFVIEDLESYNHTWVNDERLEPRKPMPLRHGDEVRVCGYVFFFQEHDSDVRSTVEASISPAPYPKLLEAQPGDKLRTLLTLGAALNKYLDPTGLLGGVADLLFDLFRQADRCFVIDLDPARDELTPVIVKTRQNDLPGPFSSAIVRRCLQTRDAYLSEDVTQEQEYGGNQSVTGSPMRSVMCVPIVLPAGQAVGVLQLDSGDRSKKFTRDDLQFLVCVAGQVAVALEFIHLHQASLQRHQLEDDLRDARDVQRGLLPQSLPSVPGYEFFAHYEPARSVGGDYYDFIPLPGGRLLVLLGDVSGKGLSAALLMARLGGAAPLCCVGQELGAAVAELNDQVLRVNAGERFVTLIAAVLDPVAHRVTLASAGHYSPEVYRADHCCSEEGIPESVGGLPLGVQAGPPYETVTLDLAPGDAVVLYSDGILDTGESAAGSFGKARLKAALRTDPMAPPSGAGDLARRLIDAVRRHAQGCEQFDDISLVCFGRLP